ncbi:hypothetical protein [Collinsella aerofaciens]|nr:MAG TPA: hypothetical protein [Caudoviricetes sp.]
MEQFFNALGLIAGVWVVLSSAVEWGVKHGIKGALKNITIKVNTYDHR